MNLRIPAFYQAVLVVLTAYLIFDNAFPPVLPQTLMIQYMAITIVGVLLYFSFDDARWAEFLSPMQAILRDHNKGWLRAILLIAIPSLVGWTTYQWVKPSLDAPVELRQVHPAPPSSLKLFDRRYDLTKLQNPIRNEVIDLYSSDREVAMQVYNDSVLAGRDVYYQNCFYCHGDLLDGTGLFADGFTNPRPINFQDVGTIAQLEEAFLFWRISTGGPGLPREGTPWNSAMPAWHEYLSENEVWQVITCHTSFSERYSCQAGMAEFQGVPSLGKPGPPVEIRQNRKASSSWAMVPTSWKFIGRGLVNPSAKRPVPSSRSPWQ